MAEQENIIEEEFILKDMDVLKEEMVKAGLKTDVIDLMRQLFLKSKEHDFGPLYLMVGLIFISIRLGTEVETINSLLDIQYNAQKKIFNPKGVT